MSVNRRRWALSGLAVLLVGSVVPAPGAMASAASPAPFPASSGWPALSVSEVATADGDRHHGIFLTEDTSDTSDADLNRWIVSVAPNRVDLGLGVSAEEWGIAVSGATAQTLVAGAMRELGATVTDRYPTEHASATTHLVIETDGTLREEDLLDLPGVVHATRDLRLERTLDPALAAIQAGDAHINTAFAGARADGSGQVVVVIDDGIDRHHPFFAGPGASRVAAEYCVNRETDSDGCSEPRTGEGAAAHYIRDGRSDIHGTHVAGIAAGAGGPNGAQRGVAEAADIWAVKVFNRNGGASIVDIDRALTWVSNSANTASIAAVNMSLGSRNVAFPGSCDDYSPTTTALINHLVDRDITVVVAAGNEAFDTKISWPACIKGVIAVGATNSQRTTPSITSFTNLSTHLKDTGVMAPGFRICSAIPANQYGCLSGTSMAAPMVAGAVTLMRQVSTSATPSTIRAALRGTATATQAYSSNTYLRINVAPAIAAMGSLTGTLQLTVNDATPDDRAKTPFANQEVTLSATAVTGALDPVTTAVTTAPDGVVFLSGLERGVEWVVTVSAAGYGLVAVEGVNMTGAMSTTTAVADLIAVTGTVNVTLSAGPAGATFDGPVTVTLEPEPGTGWPVRIRTAEDAATTATVTVAIPSVRVGTWKLQAATGVMTSDAVDVSVSSDATTSVDTLVVDRLTGNVVLNVISGFSDAGLDTAFTVIATPTAATASARVAPVAASSSGEVTLSALPLGDWEVAVSSQGFALSTTSVTVTATTTTSAGVTLTPLPRNVIGRVVIPGAARSDTGGLATMGGAARTRSDAAEEMAGAPGVVEVVLTPAAGGASRTVSGWMKDGRFDLEGVPTGQWNASISAFGWVTNSAVPLTVEPGPDAVHIDVVMVPRANLSNISPTSGSTNGGAQLTVSGIHFTGLAAAGLVSISAVTIGTATIPASQFVSHEGDGVVIIVPPAVAAAAVPVGVLDAAGNPVPGTALFTYVAPPAPPPALGGGGGAAPPPGGTVVTVRVPAPQGGAATVRVAVPAGELTIGFEGLSGAGELRVESRTGPPAEGGAGVRLIGGHLDISLTGANFGEAEVCIPYRAVDLTTAGVTAADVRLVHFAALHGRLDITTRVDVAASRVCGRAAGFSPFGIGVYETTRIAGANRYQTAVQISTAEFAPGVPVVYLASGAQFPDALAAAAAAAREGGPVLLTEPSRLTSIVRTELQRLRPARIVIVGGTAAVRGEVEQAVRAAVPTARLERRQGADRYQTAAAISQAAFPAGVAKVYLATGRTFPDALAGAAAAGRDGAPVLLVPGAGPGAGVPTAVAAELARLAPGEVIILGGTAAITHAVSAQVGQIVPAAERIRINGLDRYDTAARLAEPCATGRVFVATGAGFADALAGAVAAGRSGCPMLLVPPAGPNDAVRSRLGALAPSSLTVLGGGAAVSFSAEAGLAAYLPG